MYKDYTALRADLDKGKTSVVKITEEYIKNIEKGKHLNAFLSIFANEAHDGTPALKAATAAGS